jgi:hypothetical protein
MSPETMKSSQTLTDYVDDMLAILRVSIAQYHMGAHAFYRVAAAQLRMLLCDTVRLHDQPYELSLLPEVYPTLRLPAMDENGQPNPHQSDLSLADWLEQNLVFPDKHRITLKQLIRSVCDQDGGAHVDRKERAVGLAAQKRADMIIRLSEIIVGLPLPES